MFFSKNIGGKSLEDVFYDIDKPISKEDLSEKFSDDELFNYFDQIIEFAQKIK
ncbi:MAG: hypothetical protein IPG48_05030 [Saprospiraceae bacterium]|nr:hypothetical protein [Saprospiraceae bacterium]